MPLRTISGEDAIANIRGNPYGDWPPREPADANRIEPYCAPGFSPTFTLEPGEKVFTIGSCFARNIEKALAKRGFDVPALGLAWPDKFFDAYGQGVLNNYGVVSIENEFRWALDPERPFDSRANVLEVGPQKFLDPHLASVRPSSFEKMQAYREAVTNVTRQVAGCRIVIMTLGLSELWYDNQTGTYLNYPPLRRMVLQNPARFEVRLLNFHETLASLENVIVLLSRFCRTDQRILLTVSPVPMNSTHTDGDVIVVNSYSKSVLRTAAEHVAAAHSHIDYFPSYESVLMSDRDLTWQDDQLHIRDALIQLNVNRMLEAYLPGGARAPMQTKLIIRDARDEIAAGQPQTALRTLAPLRDASEIDPDFAIDYAELCLALGHRADAEAAIAKVPVKGNAWRRKAIENLIAIHDGKVEEGLAAMWTLAESQPKTPIVWRTLSDVLYDLKRWDEALIATRRWSQCMNVERPGPFRRAATIHRAKGDMEAANYAYREMAACKLVDDAQMMEFVEFLLEQKRFDEAARELQYLKPETTAMVRKIEELKTFLPSAPGDA